MNDSQRIVLFGAQGQLGFRLMQALTNAGYEVTGIDRARCDFAVAALKDIAVILRAVEPALVINAAAYTAVDMAESEPEMAHRVNGETPSILAEICAQEQLPLLHFSTDYVFDGLRGAPYHESATTHPLNVYGASKLAGEQAVLAKGGYVFRLQWVFDSRRQNFFCTMQKLLAEKEELRVVADQWGAPSHAMHIAQAVTHAVSLMLEKKLPPDLYHLAARGYTSWHGFACAIAKACRSAVRVVPVISAEYSTPAARPKDARLDCSVLASHGIAMPHWREGLTDAMEAAHADD